MRLISWNINGLRAVLKKGFLDFVKESEADVISLQEIKMKEGQAILDLGSYEEYYNYAQRAGYSGTATFTLKTPLSVTRGMGIQEHDNEGRVLTLEYDDFYLINVYTPNSKRELERLEYRGIWDDAFRAYALSLEEKKPVVICGDLNVAHQEIDLKNPAQNRRSAGFTDEEREKFTHLLQAGYVDSFRHLYPDVKEAYTWWSYITKARERNAGWRIDYFVVSNRLKDKIKDAGILNQVMGSDHCPVYLELDVQ